MAKAKSSGENPVIAGRVSPELHKRIKLSAKASGRSMSEEIAFRAEQAFNFEASFQSLEKLRAEQDLLISLGKDSALSHWKIRPVSGRPGWFYEGDTPHEEIVALNPALQSIIERAAERGAEVALQKRAKGE